MADAGRSRKSINKDLGRLKRVFKWGVEEELIDAGVFHRLQAVEGLKKGQTSARETDRVPPVPVEHVDAVLPHLPPPVVAMVRFQLLTGTRPQEVCGIRPCEVSDRGGGVWAYVPAVHKTEHHDREKLILIGPRAQEVLKPWLDRSPTEYCFTPAESVAWMRARRRKQPGPTRQQEPPAGLNPKYTRHSYRTAIQRACVRAKVPVWAPNQLRHTRATQIRAAYGSIEAAGAVLGHAETNVAEIYAERDIALAARVMLEIG
ncbi:MAG: site-specific integrase [Gemmataceae bacterium]|nr:site-specific integrase [Gemmataceae bacterium]